MGRAVSRPGLALFMSCRAGPTDQGSDLNTTRYSPGDTADLAISTSATVTHRPPTRGQGCPTATVIP